MGCTVNLSLALRGQPIETTKSRTIRRHADGRLTRQLLSKP
jgi:hypothetical protein